MQSIEPLWADFTFKDHQLAGIKWMLSLEKGGSGGILCDEMGLGKTMQMVGLIKSGVNTSKRTLLVAPVAVLEQWTAVITRSGMGVAKPHPRGGWDTKGAAIQVCVIGYEMAAQRPQLLAAYEWDRIIYDEAHRLGSGNKSTEIATGLKGKKWLLTATPIVNGLKNLANLFKVMDIKIPTHSLEAMTPLIERYIMARTMDQLRASMPDAPPKPTFQTHRLDFSTEEEAEFYRGMSGVIQKRWKALGSDSALEKLQLFMRLRQLSLHPQIYIAARKKAIGKLYNRPDWVGSSTKFEAISKMVAKGRWIVFCHFHKEMDMLKELIGEAQIYSGAQTAAQKAAVLAWSHEAGDKVLLVQLQSGGVGLNLQHFNRVLFTGPWWTKALMDQAVGRAVRIGQRDVVEVHHVVLKEEEAMNIDTYMNDKAAAKGDLCKKVLEKGTSLLK